MAAERIHNVSASSSTFSYANAVLNFKNDGKTKPAPEKNSISNKADQAVVDQVDKCNKENERRNENVNSNAKIIENENRGNVDLSSNSVNNTEEHDHDDFIDYNGSKRKKKIAKMKKKELASQSTTAAPSRSILCRPERIRPPPKRRDKALTPFPNEDELNSVSSDIVYVAAPVPKVNPWVKNRNAASVIKGEYRPINDTRDEPADFSKYFISYRKCLKSLTLLQQRQS